MEHGYYHPDRGYWQANCDVPQHIRDGYPEGTIEVPVKPSAQHELVDGAWVYVAPVIDATAVIAERDRRLGEMVGAYTESEQRTWHAQVAEAQAFQLDPLAPTPMLSPMATARGISVDQMVGLVMTNSTAFSAGSGAILAAATALIAMEPIPTDYTDDGYWP